VKAQPLVQVKDIEACYGRRKVLKGLSFNVYRGELLAIVGPNGCGKTTLLRVLAGTLPPVKGDVIVNGASMRKDPVTAKRNVGYMMEGDRVYGELSALDNVVIYAKFYNVPDVKGKTIELLRKLGLHDLSRKASKLSIGEKRKLSLARALIHDPPVLLLDEPTSNLDPAIASEVRQTLESMKESKSIIFCSHNLYEVKDIASKMAVMEEGSFIFMGDPKNIEEV
jgi:ABC-2 type transport system ATP-binding protein